MVNFLHELQTLPCEHAKSRALTRSAMDTPVHVTAADLRALKSTSNHGAWRATGQHLMPARQPGNAL